MRCVASYLVLLLLVCFSTSSMAEWEAFDAYRANPSSLGSDAVDPLSVSNPTPTIPAEGCPDGTHYSSHIDASTLTYTESCENDLAADETASHGEIQVYGGRVEMDPWANESTSSAYDSLTASSNPFTSVYAAGRIGASENNPFLEDTRSGDYAYREYQNSDNPFIQAVQSNAGLQMDFSLVERVKGDIVLQEKIRSKLSGTPLQQQFDGWFKK